MKSYILSKPFSMSSCTSPETCKGYAQQQGVDATYLCAFMNDLGLKSYATEKPKQAWNEFVENINTW